MNNVMKLVNQLEKRVSNQQKGNEENVRRVCAVLLLVYRKMMFPPSFDLTPNYNRLYQSEPHPQDTLVKETKQMMKTGRAMICTLYIAMF